MYYNHQIYIYTYKIYCHSYWFIMIILLVYSYIIDILVLPIGNVILWS
jgi:hypothetical protein